VVKVYDSDVFRGCSLESDEDNSDSLQSLNPVSQVWPSRKYQLAPITPSVVLTDEAIITNYSIHAMTGVDKIHDAGVTGKGAQVAIVDTGVSYDHPTVRVREPSKSVSVC
jgi:subtilisin family serine protease